MPRHGRIAARAGWLLATAGLTGLGVVDLAAAGHLVTALNARGGGAGTVAATLPVAVLLAVAGALCLLCAPLCGPRVAGRRPRGGRARRPGLLHIAEGTARITTAACVVVAALEAHESAHLWFTRGPGAGPVLARIALHPIALIAAGVAAAAISRRWSRLVHAARRPVSPTARRTGISR